MKERRIKLEISKIYILISCFNDYNTTTTTAKMIEEQKYKKKKKQKKRLQRRRENREKIRLEIGNMLIVFIALKTVCNIIMF